MNKKILLIFILLSTTTSITFATDNAPIDDVSFIGFSSDNTQVVYERHYGLSANWSIQYIVVKNVETNIIEETYQCNQGGRVNKIDYDSKEWKTYNNSKSKDQWLKDKDKYKLYKTTPSYGSPSGIWTIEMEHIDKGDLVLYSTCAVSGTTSLSDYLNGTVFEYSLGKWPPSKSKKVYLSVNLVSIDNSISLFENKLIYHKTKYENRYKWIWGYIQTYWSHDESVVVAVWHWEPTVGGGGGGDIAIKRIH